MALLRFISLSRWAVVSCGAAIFVFGPNTAYGAAAEILLCSPPSQGQSESNGAVCVDGRSSMLATARDDAPHVTFGRAADLVGHPVAYVRPIRTSVDVVGGSLATRLATGLMPSGMPVAAYGLTSSFGLRVHPLLGGLRAHAGIDLAAPTGSPIFATSDGTVGMADRRGGYGLFVSLDHGGGVQTRYGHMSRLNVAVGQQVHKGNIIGFVGSTGLSTGPHLHYEVRLNGQAVNPVPYLKSR